MNKNGLKLLPIIFKKCSICKKDFSTIRIMQNICSWKCRQIANKERSRYCMRKLRHKTQGHKKQKYFKHCEICGYEKVIDIHHEGNKIFRLCPNHHALITRGIKTIEDLFREHQPSIP